MVLFVLTERKLCFVYIGRLILLLIWALLMCRPITRNQNEVKRARAVERPKRSVMLVRHQTTASMPAARADAADCCKRGHTMAANCEHPIIAIPQASQSDEKARGGAFSPYDGRVIAPV